MKRQIRKWALRLTATALFIFALLLIIVLNPILTYANKTTDHQYSIFHNTTLETDFISRLNEANRLLATSEFYDSDFHLDICLNDGSRYPGIIRTFRGQAFAWGFYNKVVMQGTANSRDNYVELNGYRWNLSQLLAHEMTHCMQYNKLGFWHSRPVKDIPNWKWEGYAEYVSRQNDDQKDLFTNLTRLQAADKNAWEIRFADGTIAPKVYYDNWVLVQYCMDIRKMSYAQVLADTTNEKLIREEMMQWFDKRK